MASASPFMATEFRAWQCVLRLVSASVSEGKVCQLVCVLSLRFAPV